MAAAFYPIVLRLEPAAWPKFVQRKYDPKFRGLSQKVMRRDMYTCQFCGFQAGIHMEVVNLDGDYMQKVVNIANLVTACPFCTQCFFLEMVGKTDYGGGKMIYLPSLPQNQLNALSHVLYCAVAKASDYAAEAQNIINLLRLRANHVEDHLGKGLSEPAMLAQMLIDTPLKERDKVMAAVLKDLRILPAKAGFRLQIEQWAKTSLYADQGKD
jgi:intracellular multiplication protein IcmJ